MSLFLYAAAFGLLIILLLFLIVAIPAVLFLSTLLPFGKHRKTLKILAVVLLIVSSPYLVGKWMYGPNCEGRGVPLTAPVTHVNGEACDNCSIEFCRRCRAIVRRGDRKIGYLRWTQHTDPESPGHYYKLEGKNGHMSQFGYPASQGVSVSLK